MYLLDAHIHSAGISPCSRVSPSELVDLCAKEELGGIVLTNHYKRSAVRGTFAEWRKRYTEEYEITRALGEKRGLRVFFGVEITPDSMPCNDFTVYGLAPQDIETADELFALSLTEIAAYVHARGALIYQAHPYRNTTPADGTLIDGVEINCHPLYGSSHADRVRAFADLYGLRISCGSDYHGDTYKSHCGILVPDDVNTGAQLAAFLRDHKRPELRIEPIETNGK